MQPRRRLMLAVLFLAAGACVPDAHMRSTKPATGDGDPPSGDGDQGMPGDGDGDAPSEGDPPNPRDGGQGTDSSDGDIPESWDGDAPGDGDLEILDPPGQHGVASCHVDSSAGGVPTSICVEWQSEDAGSLERSCQAPGTRYRAAPCDRAGAVGVCAYPEEQGLTIRTVWFSAAEANESACISGEGSWQAP